MGRSILFEKDLENTVNQLFESQYKLQVGLVLGQQSESKDFGIHLVRCPDPLDDDAELEMSSSGEDDMVVIKTKKKKNQESSKTPVTENDIIDMKWIGEHGRQVSRMLTGGINVLGIFVYCSPEILLKNQPKIPLCLVNLHKNIGKNKFLRKGYLHDDRYLLHVCSVTRKLTCRTINITEDHPSLKPADYRYQSFLSGWSSVSTVIDTNINICVPLSQKAAIDNTILNACQNEIESIWESYAALDHKLVNEDELLNNTSKQTKTKHQSQQEESKVISITLFKQPDSRHLENAVNFESANLEVKFFGCIQSKAFLHSKANYNDAVSALKVDIIRSLLTRIELLCEEAEVNNLDGVEEWSLVSPTRVFVPYQNSNVLFCDYSFKDESPEDICNRFTELLNIKPSPTDLIIVERSPEISEVSMIFHANDKASDQQSDIASEISNSLVEESRDQKFVIILVGVLVVLIGIVIHLIFNT